MFLKLKTKMPKKNSNLLKKQYNKKHLMKQFVQMKNIKMKLISQEYLLKKVIQV